MFGFKSASRKSTNRKPSTLRMEPLEQRNLMSVNKLFFSGNTLCVQADNNATSVTVTDAGTNYKINDLSTNRSWLYAKSSVGSVEFQGGAGNDRFVNWIANLNVRGFGYGGNDHFEGWNGNDTFAGGAGDDTIKGYGGNDVIWGEAGNDTLLGMIGDDQLIGGDGYDHLNGGAGNDKMWGGNNDDVLIAIDAAIDSIVNGESGNDIMWVDSSKDTVSSGSGDKVQSVASFANGADRTLDGDRIADPSSTMVFTREDGTRYNDTYAYKQFAGRPLFATSGARDADIQQGGVGDCWLLAGLGSVANNAGSTLRQNVVDFDDGTYGVRLGSNFYRVDNDLPVDFAGYPAFAQLGAEGSMWVAVVEKAFAHYRTGANSYQSLSGGWGREVAKAFGSTDAVTYTYNSATAAANAIANNLTSGRLDTVAIDWWNSGTNSYSRHELTVVGWHRNAAGAVTSITLKNPWGYDGNGIKINGAFVTDSSAKDGLISLSIDQLYKLNPNVSLGRV